MLKGISSSTYQAVTNSKHFSRNMFKMCQRPELEKMTKDDLIRKVLNLQSLCGQLKNKQHEVKSKHSKMMNVSKNSRFAKNSSTRKGLTERLYRYIAIKVAYLGWDYDGLQSNPGLDDSIENILRGALLKTKLVDPSDPVKFSKCGRTDKGVSSFDQVMTLCVNSKLKSGLNVMPVKTALAELERVCSPNKNTDDHLANENKEKQSDKDNAEEETEEHLLNEYDYATILNRVLPEEIRILGWAPLKSFDFSARHDCNYREYRYYFPKGKLNIDLMSTAAQNFCGLNDYRNFCKINVANCKTFVRRINCFEILPFDKDSSNDSSAHQFYFAKIQGSGFVYHQVRSMMAILFLVGLKRENPSIIKTLLDVKDVQGKPSFGLAKETPLVLFKTSFNENLQWRIAADAYAKLMKNFQLKWSELAARTTMTKALIESIEQDTDIKVFHTAHEYIAKGNSNNFCDLSKQIHLESACHAVNSEFLNDNYPIDSKRYKAVLDRPRGKRLEEHFEHLEKKKQRMSTKKSEDDLKKAQYDLIETLNNIEKNRLASDVV